MDQPNRAARHAAPRPPGPPRVIDKAGAELVAQAREYLAKVWGLDRPLTSPELGRVLQLSGANPGNTVVEWERRHTAVSGPVRVALGLMGELPDALLDEAIAAAGEVDACEISLQDALLEQVGDIDEVKDILEDLVLTIAEIVRRPVGVAEAVELDLRTREQFRADRRRRDRFPPGRR